MVDDDGRLDLERTVAAAPALAAVGVTVVSPALGWFLADRRDVDRFLGGLGATFA